MMTSNDGGRDSRQTTAADVPVVRRAIPGGRLWLWIGVGLFALSMAAGLVRSYRLGRALPPVGVEYTTELSKAFRSGHRDAALHDLRLAAKIDFDNYLIVGRLVEETRAGDDRDEAIRALMAMTRLKPEDSQVRNELVAALLEERRFAEAYVQGHLAVLLSPDMAETHCNFGLALLGVGQPQQAAAAFQRALELDPSLQQARQGLAAALRGR